MEPNVVFSICCWNSIGNVVGSRPVASNARIRHMCWLLFARSVDWNVWERRCATRGVLLAEVAPEWLLEHMDQAWAERYEKRFSDFRLPKDEKKRVELAETIGADGRRLLEAVYAESNLPWLRDLDAIQTLRRVWLQHYHASEQGTPWRADGELPPSAVLITSPSDVEARSSRKKSTAWTGYKVHFTETCEADTPHLMVEVAATSATIADGDIVGERNPRLATRQMLPREHLMDAGSVDAEVLALSSELLSC